MRLARPPALHSAPTAQPSEARWPCSRHRAWRGPCADTQWRDGEIRLQGSLGHLLGFCWHVFANFDLLGIRNTFGGHHAQRRGFPALAISFGKVEILLSLGPQIAC